MDTVCQEVLPQMFPLFICDKNPEFDYNLDCTMKSLQVPKCIYAESVTIKVFKKYVVDLFRFICISFHLFGSFRLKTCTF
jgi:hypothetical protein